MPLTGKLLADFSSFSDAVSKAEVQLRGMETGAGKVEKSLNRMVDNFSGRKLIQDATLSAEAIERIGGTSHLTAAELQRVGAQASQAVDKLRAMGKDVPPGIEKIAKEAAEADAKLKALGRDAPPGIAKIGAEANTAGSALDKMKGIAGGLAGALGIGLSIGAVVSFGKSVFDSASQIHDLSIQLGISSEAVQGFKFAAEQSGSSLDTVSGAITKMNKNLSGGDKATVAALKSAGLGFAEIRAMKPEDAFLAITDAVQKIPDPMLQTQVAMQLLGKGAAELLPAIKEGFRGVAEGASKMSEDTINSLEAAQDAWDALFNKVTIISGQMIAATMNVTKEITSSWRNFGQFVTNSLQFGVGAASAMADLSAAAKKAGADVNLSLPPALAKTKEELDAVEAAQKKAAEAAKAHAAAIAALAGKLSGSDATKAAKDLLEALKRTIPVQTMTRQAQEEVNRTAKAAIDVYRAQGKEIPEALFKVYQATFRLTDTIPRINKWGESLAHSADGIVSLIQVQDRAWPTTIAGLEAVFSANTKNIFQMKTLGDTITDNVLGAFGRIPDLMEKAFTGGGNMIGAMKAIGVAMADAIMTPIMAGLDKFQKAAVSAGAAAATAFGGAAGGGIGAQIAGIAASLGGAAIAASAWGTAMAAAGAAGALALGAVTLGIGAAAVGIAALVKHFTDAKGRDAVKKFADDQGGFDRLHAKLLEMGAQGEALWIKLTQGVGKNNPKQAAAVIDEITAAWERHAKSVSEAEAAVAKQAEEQSEAHQKALDEIKGLNDQIDSLNRTVANEAPEEVMGVIEQQTRAQIDAITKQRDAAQKAIDDTAGSAADSAEEAAKEIDRALAEHEFIARLKFDLSDLPRTIDIPATSSMPGFATGTAGYQNFGRGTAVMLHGWEKVTPRGRGDATDDGGYLPVTIMTPIGEVVARELVRVKKRLRL